VILLKNTLGVALKEVANNAYKLKILNYVDFIINEEEEGRFHIKTEKNYANSDEILTNINKYCNQGKKGIKDVLEKVTVEFKDYEIPEDKIIEDQIDEKIVESKDISLLEILKEEEKRKLEEENKKKY